MGLITDIGSVALSAGQSLYNSVQQADTNQWNRQNALFGMRQNQLNQEKIWDREDNAVQRRVNDLKGAGINPILAAGSAAQTSSPIRVGNYESNPNQSDLGSSILSGAEKAKALMSEKTNIARSNMQIELNKKQLAEADLDYDAKAYNLDYARRNKLPFGANPDWKNSLIKPIIDDMNRKLQSPDPSTKSTRKKIGDNFNLAFPLLKKLSESDE